MCAKNVVKNRVKDMRRDGIKRVKDPDDKKGEKKTHTHFLCAARTNEKQLKSLVTRMTKCAQFTLTLSLSLPHSPVFLISFMCVSVCVSFHFFHNSTCFYHANEVILFNTHIYINCNELIGLAAMTFQNTAK